MVWQGRKGSRDRMGLRVRTGLDCCPAAPLAIRVRASNVAPGVQMVQVVR